MAVKRTSLLEYFNSKVKQYESDKKSNYKSYKTTNHNLVEFLGRKRPSVMEIDFAFFEDFRRFCEKNKDYKKSMVHQQFKNLKAILSKAYDEKLLDNQDYKKFKIGEEQAVNVYLSLDELDKIYDLKFHNHLHLDRTRDSFIVAAFTGLRFIDWGRVRTSLIRDEILTIKSTKTFEVSQIPVHKYVKAILKKYNGAMPQQLTNQKTNKYLKVICWVARLNDEIEKPYTKGGKRSSNPEILKKWQMVSTHTARRSLCTNLILQGANPFVVMKISGHKDMESFQKYVKLDELMAADELKKLPMFSN